MILYIVGFISILFASLSHAAHQTEALEIAMADHFDERFSQEDICDSAIECIVGNASKFKQHLAAYPDYINRRVELGQSFLHRAVATDNTKAAQFLLERKADPNQGDDFNTTPLMTAIFNRNEAMIALLLRSGAHITPGICQYALEKSSVNILKLLLAYKTAGIRTEDQERITGLIYLLSTLDGTTKQKHITPESKTKNSCCTLV